MPTIAEIRQQYPQYSDMSDDQLAGALHQKYYADMPEDVFRQKIGMQPAKESLGGRIAGELMGAGEAALGVATGVPAALGGGLTYGATLAATGDPEAAKAVQERTQETLTYQPRTKYGQADIGAIGNIMQAAVEKPSEAAGELTRRGAQALGATPEESGALGAAAKTGVQAIPFGLGLKGSKAVGETLTEQAGRFAAKGEAKAAARAADVAARNQAIETARSIGLRLAPSQAGGPLGQAAEMAAGSARLEKELSAANAPAVNRAAAADIGLETTSEEGLQQRTALANQKYQAVRDFGRVEFSDTFREKLNKVRETTAKESLDFPEDVNDAVEKEIQKYNKAGADADSMMSKIIKLRQRATKNIKTGDAEKAELGYAQKKIANAMEEELERHGMEIGRGDDVQQFRDARVELAKIHNIDEAMVGTNVSPRLLAKAYDRGEPLTANLLKIAKSYKSFPKVLRDAESMGGNLPFTVVDYLVGFGGALHNPALLSAVMARPAARALLRSQTYQKSGIKPRTPKPSIAAQAARKFAEQPNTLESLATGSGALPQASTLE